MDGKASISRESQQALVRDTIRAQLRKVETKL